MIKKYIIVAKTSQKISAHSLHDKFADLFMTFIDAVYMLCRNSFVCDLLTHGIVSDQQLFTWRCVSSNVFKSPNPDTSIYYFCFRFEIFALLKNTLNCILSTIVILPLNASLVFNRV